MSKVKILTQKFAKSLYDFLDKKWDFGIVCQCVSRSGEQQLEH